MKKSVLLAMALILALAASYGEYMYFSSQVKTTGVIVATQDIMPGDSLKGKVAVIQARVNAGNLIKSDNGYAKVAIKRGSLITEEMITDNKPSDDNLRKVTVKTDLESSVAGTIKPGDYVDIGYVPKSDNNQQGQPQPNIQPQVIFTDVQVFKVTDATGAEFGKGIRQDNAVPATVTLLMDENDAVKLKDYENKGTIFFMAK